MVSARRLVADRPPNGHSLTDYDRRHAHLYFRLIDAADADGDWRSVARDVLGLDPASDEARGVYDRHLARARWMVGEGWKQLLSDRLADPRDI